MRATGKIVGVTTQSVMRWIRQMHNKFITEKTDIATVTEVEMDENRKYYVRKTIEHRSEKLIGWALGRRDTKTLIKTTVMFIQIVTKAIKISFPKIT